MRLLKIGLSGVLLLATLAMAGCATKLTQRDGLERVQYAWSAAIRWGDIDGATNLIDPKLRASAPPTAVELERYKHVQISAYRDLGATSDLEQGVAVRDIEIGVINRHTQAERSLRYREQWRWDPESKVWWVTSGLPDLWAGQ